MSSRIISVPPLGRDFETSRPTLEGLIEAVNTGQRAKKDILNSYIKVADLIELELLRLSKDEKTLISFQPEFAAATLQNGWVNYDPATYNSAGYYKHHGRVYLRGLIRTGTINTAAFTLPAGFRPRRAEILSVLSADAVGRVDVRPNGQVVPINPPSTNTWICLDSCSFVAVQ